MKDIKEAFRKFRKEEMRISTSTEEVFNAGYQAALSAVPANHVGDSNEMGQEPEKDIAESITLLSAIFDAWENGTDCYDDFDGVSGSFIGKAFNLDDKIFKRCCSLLNRINPPRNVSQQPAQEPLQKQLEEITRRHDQQVRINKRLIKAWKDAQQPAQKPVAYRVIASTNGEVVRDSLEFTRMSEIDEKVVRKSYKLQIIPLYVPEIYSRSSLEQFDLDQSKEYNVGRKDGRVIGYEVGYRHAIESSQAQQPAQEPVGEVQHYAAPANLPAYVNMKWYGKPPKNGTKLYTAPVKQESKP